MSRFTPFARHRAVALSAAALAALALPAALASAQDAAKPAVAKLTAEQMAKGRQMFQDNSCGGCHTLADGGGAGAIGPSLDGNTGLDHALVVNRVSNGSGPMPGFASSLKPAEIELLASYVIQARK